jgi:D-alanine-D-alanine ligase
VGLAPELEKRISSLVRRAYRALYLTGYARIDLRLGEDGGVWVLEANPNPDLSFAGEFAESARSDGMAYPELLQRILNLGLCYRATWQT